MNPTEMAKAAMRATKPWTSEEETALATMLSEGKTLRQAAETLGRSYSSACCKSGYLGLKTSHRTDYWSRDSIDTLCATYRQPGWTADRIAEEVGHSADAVYKKAKTLNLDNPSVCYQCKPEETDRQVIILASQDLSLREVGRRCGVSRDYARTVIARSAYHARRRKARESMRRAEGQHIRWSKEVTN